MVSKEPNHLPSATSANGNSDKAMTVRSVLLNRDSPDIETRLKRRRNRTQQVRFKDLEDGVSSNRDGGRRWSGAEQGSPHPNRKSSGGGGQRVTPKEVTANGGSVVGAVRGDMEETIGAVAAILARAPPHPLTPGPTRRTWAPVRPCSLTLPNPRRHCMSTAIQTSPSLQKPPPLYATQSRSRSFGDVPGQNDGFQRGTQDWVGPHNHIQPLGDTHQDCPFPCGCQPNLSTQRPLVDEHLCHRPPTSAVASAQQGAHSRPASHPNNRQPCKLSPPSCAPTSPVINFNGPKCPSHPHGSKKRFSRTVSDPGKTVSPSPSPPQTELPLPPASPTKCVASPPKILSSEMLSEMVPARDVPSPVLPGLNQLPPSASTPKTVPHSVTSPQTLSPCALTTQTVPTSKIVAHSLPSLPVTKRSSPPKTLPSSLSQTTPHSTSPPKTVPNCTTPLKGVSSLTCHPQTVQSNTLTHISMIPLASHSQRVPHHTVSHQTILQGTSPTQTVPPSTSQPQNIQHGTSPSKTVLPSASHPQTVLNQTEPNQTVPQVISLPLTEQSCTSLLQNGLHNTLFIQTVPNSIVSHKTVLPSTAHPQTIPSNTFPPKTVLSSGSHPQTIPYQTMPHQAVQQSTTPPQTVISSVSQSQNVRHGNLTHQTVLRGTIIHNIVSHGTITNQTVSQSTITDQTIPHGFFTHQTNPHGTITHQSGQHGNLSHQTVPHSTITPKTVPHGSITHQTFPQGSLAQTVQHGTLTHQTIPHGTLTHQTIPHGSVTHPSVPYDALPYQTCKTPPQAPSTTQDSWRAGGREGVNRRDLPLPPPPPPPPPYTPRKEGCCVSGPILPPEPPKRVTGLPTHPQRAGTPSIPQKQGSAPTKTPTLDLPATQNTMLYAELQTNMTSNTGNTFGNVPNTLVNDHNIPGNMPSDTHTTPRSTSGNTYSVPSNTRNTLGNTQNTPSNTMSNTSGDALGNRITLSKTPRAATGNMLSSSPNKNPPGSATSNDSGHLPRNTPGKNPENILGTTPSNPHTPAPETRAPLQNRSVDPELTPGQAEALRQVQELLGGLVSGARGKLELAKAREKLLGAQDSMQDIGTLQTQLHSLEGVLETSQNTIKVLLDVIQDLEKKEAERDGRHSYRTGQDIENCGTCRDCACIIYSVEHDFRLQEGQFTRTWKMSGPLDSDHNSPQTGPAQTPPPCQEDPPPAPRSSHAVKKGRRKCFWFL